MRLIFIPYSWTAVCRGAVIRGLELSDDTRGPTVMSRVSRMSYGVQYVEEPWEAKRHDIRDRDWCEISQKFVAINQTHWFVRIVSTVSVRVS
jgi:hypothetical protein